jgi:hypothetical protein
MTALIYGSADGVCAWLGDGDESSNMAINFIRDEVLQLQNFDALVDSAEVSRKWSALLNLMQRSWFSRRWSVPEVALARSASLHCGRDSLEWKDFADTVALFIEVETSTRRLSEVMKKDPHSHHVPDLFEYVSALGAAQLVHKSEELFRRGSNGSITPLSGLQYLASSLALFECWNPHDAIYSLLSIAKSIIPVAVCRRENISSHAKYHESIGKLSGRRTYIIDYDKPYFEVCKEFVQICIDQAPPDRALDILCQPWAPHSKLSSSVAMSLPSWVASVENAPFALISTSGSTISMVRRKNGDSFVGLPGSPAPYYASGRQSLDSRTLKFRKRPKLGHYSLYVTGFILDEISATMPVSQGGSIPLEWFELAGWSSIEQQVPEGIWQTLVAGRGREGRNPPTYYARAAIESVKRGGLATGSVNTADLINNERSSIVAEFCRRVQRVIWNRMMVKTRRRGNLGMVPKNTRPGDLVCILYGCSVPVILRPFTKTHATRRQEEAEDHQQIIEGAARKIYSNYKLRKERRERWHYSSYEDKQQARELCRAWNERNAKEHPAGNSRFQSQANHGPERANFGRLIEPNTAEDNYSYYTLVGESYIYGMMDGEAVVAAKAENIRSCLFEIR